MFSWNEKKEKKKPKPKRVPGTVHISCGVAQAFHFCCNKINKQNKEFIVPVV